MEKINMYIKITNNILSFFRGPPNPCKHLVLDSENFKQPNGIVKKCQFSKLLSKMSKLKLINQN